MAFSIPLKKITTLVGGDLLVNDDKSFNRNVIGVSTDSRQIKQGDLFIAIKGDRFDGHDYVESALGQGAIAALVSREWWGEHGGNMPEHCAYIVVTDVLAGFQKLASWHRAQLDIKVVAITGSNGKTTTKDMTAAVLETNFRTYKTPGNLNSQLGVPQVLMSLDNNYDIAVLELGMNHAGEMSRLAEMVKPDVAVITNVGPAHLEFLHTLEGVAAAKGELLDYLSPDGWAVLNADDLQVMSQRSRTDAGIFTFGRAKGVDIRLNEINETISGSTFSIYDGSEFRLGMPGGHHVYNALAAIGVGRIFGINDEQIQHALHNLQPTPMRMEHRSVGGIEILNDTYNANPASVTAALKTLSTSTNRKIAILGDMLELGESSEQAHQNIGRLAAEYADILIAVGEFADLIADGAVGHGMPLGDVFNCDDTEHASQIALSIIHSDDVVLVKGSRGMKMETIVEMIIEEHDQPVKAPR